MNAVAEVLEAALAAMNDEGAHWTKGTYEDSGGPDGSLRYCSVGAILHGTSQVELDRRAKTDAQYEAIRVLASVIKGEDIPPMEVSVAWDLVTTWNDQQERRWPEVVAAFNEARDKAAQTTIEEGT